MTVLASDRDLLALTTADLAQTREHDLRARDLRPRFTRRNAASNARTVDVVFVPSFYSMRLLNCLNQPIGFTSTACLGGPALAAKTLFATEAVETRPADYLGVTLVVRVTRIPPLSAASVD
jgi:hypothetical protein